MAGVMTPRSAAARLCAASTCWKSARTPNPVVKILDYGKFKYEQQKKRNEPRRSRKYRDQGDQGPPNIDENDYQVKIAP